jgi:creatinine amidohydrolase
MTPRSVYWGSLRRGEIAAAAEAGAVALLPTGATEQHGPHLPLDTDINAATTVCMRAAQLLDGAAVVLPPVSWGVSPYWMGFSGTITVRPETLLALVADIVTSVAKHGFGGMVIVNGHGGNDGLLQAAAAQASSQTLRVASVSYWNLAPDALQANASGDGGNIGHAGEAETSIALHLQPHHVDVTAIEPDPGVDLPVPRQAFAEGHRVYEPPWPERHSPQAVFGHPRAATSTRGQLIIDAAVAGLGQLVRELRADLVAG